MTTRELKNEEGPAVGHQQTGYKCGVTVVDHEDLDGLQEYNTNRMTGMMDKATFYDMDSAVAFSKSRGNMPIISSDKKGSTTGAKDFRVQCYEGFLREYEAMPPQDRHHYETIFGKCHIYVDLEFSKKENKDLDGQKVTALFCELMFRFLREEIGAPEDAVGCVCMDSSSSSKFSAHLIIRLSGCCWVNNFHVGALMRQFQVYTLDRGYSRRDGQLWAWRSEEKDFSDPDEKDFVADMGVYTTRRQFRLCYSSKAGQARHLVPVTFEEQEDGSFVPHNLDAPDLDRSKVPVDRETLMCTLVQCTEPARLVLSTKEPDGTLPRSTSHKTKHLGKHVPRKLAGVWGNPDIRNWVESRVVPLSHAAKPQVSSSDLEPLKGSALPKPALEAIAWIEKTYGTRAYDPALLRGGILKLYVPVFDRHCDIAKKEHKTNHTKYVVNFRSGTYSKGCLDPDCSSQIAWTKPLPQHIKEQTCAYAESYTKDKTVSMRAFWGAGSVATPLPSAGPQAFHKFL